MVDIRDRVEEDRGLLKRIQLHIPGFAGYRRREDIRQADSILRIQLAERLKAIRAKMDSARGTLADDYQLKALEPMGRAVLAAQELEGLIRHAEQGYSGFSWAIQIKEDELDHLYEFDVALLEGLNALEDLVQQITVGGDAVVAVKACSAAIEETRVTFKRRMDSITGTKVA